MMKHMTDNQASSRDRGYRRATAVTAGLAVAGVTASLVVAGVAAAATARARADDATPPQNTTQDDATVPGQPDTGTPPLWPPLTDGGVDRPHAHSGGS
jgi:hypothetical protein